MITGYGVGSGSAKEQPLTEALLAARTDPGLGARLPQVGRGVGAGAADGLAYYVADSGFAGQAAHARWRAHAHAVVITPPGGNWQATSRERWPDALRRWLAHHRQVVEGVFDRLLFALRLSRERPHALQGFTARLAAGVALYNCCLLTNHQLDRPLLAFADLIAWSLTPSVQAESIRDPRDAQQRDDPRVRAELAELTSGGEHLPRDRVAV